MKTITLTIPDNLFPSYLEVFRQFKDVVIHTPEDNQDWDTYFTPAITTELNRRLEEYKNDPSQATDLHTFLKEFNKNNE